MAKNISWGARYDDLVWTCDTDLGRSSAALREGEVVEGSLQIEETAVARIHGDELLAVSKSFRLLRPQARVEQIRRGDFDLQKALRPWVVFFDKLDERHTFGSPPSEEPPFPIHISL